MFILNLPDLLCKLGRHEEAEPVVLGVYETHRAATGEEPVGILKRLVSIYEALGDEETAAIFRARHKAATEEDHEVEDKGD
jgi:hypothetical protein